MSREDEAQRAIDSPGVAREAYEAFQDAWREVGRITRGLYEWQWHCVDAYPSWEGNRDVGAGSDMVAWMSEVEERLDAIRSGGD